MNVNQDAKLSSTDFVIHPVRSGYDSHQINNLKICTALQYDVIHRQAAVGDGINPASESSRSSSSILPVASGVVGGVANGFNAAALRNSSFA